MWKLGEAIDFVRNLEKKIEPIGFHCTLCGSIFHEGKSDNDLDIIIYPHSSGQMDISMLKKALEEFGLIRRASRGTVARIWESKGSDDMKNVEVYRTEDNRKVDIFHLR